MILATYDPRIPALKNYVFRGEGIRYWLSRLFGRLEIFDPEKIKSGYNHLIVFDSSKFLDISPEGINDILRFFRNRKSEPGIFTLSDFPFFIFSKQTQKKHSIKLAAGICKNLSKQVNIRFLDLKGNYRVLDVQKNLRKVEEIILNLQINEFVKQKILIEDYANFYIEGRVLIGRGTRISSGVVIKGNSKIGKNVSIFPNSYIENSVIADDSTVLPSCVIRDSILEKKTQVGPYTHLRAGSIIKSGAKAGNFVEMKKSVLGRESKSMHLSYIGDATVGERVNIGAGTITCNYDGARKHHTTIDDNVFIGSGTELVAPVKVGKNSLIGAGSTITENVPPHSLAIARTRQINKKDWVKKKKKQG